MRSRAPSIKNLETQLSTAEMNVQLRQSELDTIQRSLSWQLAQYVWRLQMRIFPYGTRRRHIYRATLLRLGRLLFRGDGAPLTQEGAYRSWIRRNEANPAQLKKMAQAAKKFAYRPVISIVVPVYQTPETLLREAIESVRNQIYDRWELCLADDGSGRAAITGLLQEYAGQDARIRFTQLPQGGGISRATNAAASLAQGEFLAFLDHDDTISPDALYQVVALLQQHRDADLIYSDEDKLGSTGERYEPFFKPDWSPDLLLSMNYVCHFLVVRRDLFEAAGRLRSEFDGSQDYDLILRLADRTSRIHHIPRVLYHWRASENSTAQSPSAKTCCSPGGAPRDWRLSGTKPYSRRGRTGSAYRALASPLRGAGQSQGRSDHADRRTIGAAPPLPGKRICRDGISQLRNSPGRQFPWTRDSPICQ